MNRLRPTRSGFALFIMLMVLAMAAAFMLVSARLLAETFRSTRQAQDAHLRAVRMDGMLKRLREDVWRATKIEVADGAAVTLSQGKASVTWSIGKDASVTRQSSGAPAFIFSGAGAGLRLEARGADLILHLGSGDRLAITSQAMLAGGPK